MADETDELPQSQSPFTTAGVRPPLQIDPAAAAFHTQAAVGPAPEPLPEPSFTAYHGSPYDFERFSSSQIGTGEGAQAYGHGLYFAGNPAVAEQYKATLANKIVAHPDDLEGAYEIPGTLYQVQINADPEHFLDWDKPLSEQPQLVKQLQTIDHPMLQEALQPMELKASTGSTIHRLLTSNAPRSFGTPGVFGFNPGYGSQAMRAAGIPGIKYLDQGSRNVAMMKPEPHEFLNGEQGWVVNGPKGDVKFDTKDEANEYINQFNTGQTHNYVVFDDNLINIVKKNGLPTIVNNNQAHFKTTPVDHDPFGDE